MPHVTRSSLILALALLLVSHLAAQQADDDPQRITLTGLRKFAVYARVQLSEPATLQPVDEALLRAKIESAMRREGISIVNPGDIRDGSAAQVSLLYLVVETRDKAGQKTGFAASSCLHAAQTVSVPRLTIAGHPAYTVVPTWRRCGILVGDADSYGVTLLQNADEQIARFLAAWRIVNPPRPAPSVSAPPQLGISTDRGPVEAGRP